MIDVKQAASIAVQYLTDLYMDKALSNVQLEEVELSEDEKYWLITISFTESSPIPFPQRKSYKLFKIDAETGQVQSMKIREVA